MTVKEVSELTGVSIRTLHYYDEIDLLKPSETTMAGYRIYDDIALERLQQILLFRELEFPLKEISKIINGKDFDRNKALEQQIELLTMKKEHLENLITFAREIKTTGVKNMDFTPFDTKKIDKYTKKAKEQWGNTEAYHEFEQKNANRTKSDENVIMNEMMKIFVEFGKMMNEELDSDAVQNQVKKLQNYITKHFYNCTDEILAGLGEMYGAGGEFTENIDEAAGKGCAVFVSKAIEKYTK